MNWGVADYQVSAEELPLEHLAERAYELTCRNDFEHPGFCVVDVGADIDSSEFRKMMVSVKREMSINNRAIFGQRLDYLSMGRFDQQQSTRPHLDGGPEQCMLMLGYEPSETQSTIEISDYSRCAHDSGLSPKEFMVRHNPMFRDGFEMLRRYTTKLECFDHQRFQIICINNSSAEFSSKRPAWQGVLHTATVPSPDPAKRRVINSTMIAPGSDKATEPVSEAQQHDFVTTRLVRRRGYDALEKMDDQ